MTLSFKALMGSFPTTPITEADATAAGVSITDKYRIKLRTSKKLKLSKVAREGGNDKLAFLEAIGKWLTNSKCFMIFT